MAAYAASKAGLIGLTQVLASEHGPQNIRVNALLPGGTDTPADVSLPIRQKHWHLCIICMLLSVWRHQMKLPNLHCTFSLRCLQLHHGICNAGRWRCIYKSCLRGRPMSDYDRIASAMAYLVDRAIDQPSLEEIAAHVHLSPYHFQRLFCRWAGTTPKRFYRS